MTEQNPSLHAEQEIVDYQALIDTSLEHARELGFDLEQAVAADPAEKLDSDAITERATRIQEMSATIAKDIGLEAGYFERPANVMLLTGVSNMWLQNQLKAERQSYDTKIADERAMLADVILMAAGRQSTFVKDLVAGNHAEARRYVEQSESDSDEANVHEFLEDINNEALAVRVKELFAMEGEGSLLNKQRKGLGVTAETEEPYNIRVLQLGDKWDLVNAGILPKPEWPTDVMDKEEHAARSKKAFDLLDQQTEQYKEFQHNQEQYKEKFGETIGDLPAAWVDHRNGKTTLYLKAATAAKLTRMADDGVNFDEIKDNKDYNIAEPVATTRHEYVHTQKNLAMGERAQLGLVLEERKAEYISHDKLGYQDVKYFLSDLGMSHDVTFTEHLEAALQQPDALSAWMAWSATNLGLRNTVLLMAAKPLPYDKLPESRERFASMQSVTHHHDASPHDSIIRENLATEEGVQNYRNKAAEWVARLVADELNLEFIHEHYAGYRAAHGLAYANKYLLEAVDNVIGTPAEAKHTSSVDGAADDIK